MKFSHSIKFNCVQDWEKYYLRYAYLKRLIYSMESASTTPSLASTPRQISGGGSGRYEDTVSVSESPNSADAGEHTFIQALENELNRISAFYAKKEKELLKRVQALHQQAKEVEAGPVLSIDNLRKPLLHGFSNHQDAESGEQVPELQKPEVWKGSSTRVRLAREKLKHASTDLFVQLHGLMEYIELNRTGFRKVLKKYDKVTHRSLKETFMPHVEDVLADKSTAVLQGALDRLISLHAVVSCDGNSELASLELKRYLRDHVVWERNTVWKEMVERERRKAAAKVDVTPVSWRQRCWQAAALGLSSAVFLLLLRFPVFPEPAKANCLALLVFVSLLWCTEALPLFTTSMLVPLLVVLLRVLVDHSHNPPTRLSPVEAAGHIFNKMFSEVIMLLLGGFAIAAALSKHFIAKEIATWILSKVGTRPGPILLASMGTATFASMWISNVAAPVLCYSVLQPILRTLPSGHPFSRALVMGIALASNIGGMASPISSPQNIFAIELMSLDGSPPSWLNWLAVTLPLCVVGNVLLWFLLMQSYQPHKAISHTRPLRPRQDPWNWTQVYVVVVSFVTVGLWCANSHLQRITGQMGVVAILPLVAFFGTAVLDKDDFNNFLWNVVMLAMGGLALGEAVTSSGLLLTLAEGLKGLVAGCSTWQVLAIFCGLVLVTTTFISHTVGAMVILPIVQSVGAHMPDPHPKLLVMGAALTCSAAMGLPVSGFPNMNAISLEDPTGQPYLQTLDFLRIGVPSSGIAYILIISVGYVLMTGINGW